MIKEDKFIALKEHSVETGGESKEKFIETKVAVIQMEAEPHETEKNLKQAETLVQQAVDKGARLIVLPELFNAGYTWHRKIRKSAEDMKGPTLEWMGKISKDKSVYLAGTILEKEKKKFYDTMILTTPIGSMHRYRKVFPFYPELLTVSPGKKPLVVKTKELGKIGFMTCWDIMHRAMVNYYKMAKIDLLIISSAWPASGRLPGLGGLKTLDRKVRELPAKVAKELGVPVLLSQQMGTFDSQNRLIPMKSKFISVSGILDEQGQFKKRVPFDQEGVVVADLKLKTGDGS